MKGYKYLKEGMKAPFQQDFVYEIDRWYEVEDDSKLEICGYGFHFFPKLQDLFNFLYYAIWDRIDIYEVEADGEILYENTGFFVVKACCSSKIRLIKKLSEEDISKIIDNEGILHNSNWRIRDSVAKCRYCLDKLVDDDNTFVRAAVARYGYGLDKLVDDECSCVRMEVAKHGYGLDKLIDDEDWLVRREVALKGYGLDILINDEDEYVASVAFAVRNSDINKYKYT